MLMFAIDTDIKLTGRVSDETMSAVNKAGYSYENGALMPLEEKEGTMENQNNMPEISVKVYPVQPQENSRLMAFAGVTVGGCFAVTGIRVMDSEKGKFVAMPSSKGSDGKYRDICFPTTAEMRKAINEAVLGEYRKTVETGVR